MTDENVLPGQLSLMPEVAPSYSADLAQWFTPPPLASRIAHRFILPGSRVIEPTAGSGALVDAALNRGAKKIRALDIDPRWVRYLRGRFAHVPDIVEPLERNYLSTHGEHFRDQTILMNPPDASKEGIHLVDFLEKAMFDVGPRGDVVALIRLNALNGFDRYTRVWSRATIRTIAYLSRRPAYSGEGGGKQEWCVVRYGLPYESFSRGKCEQRPVTEWWPDAWN